MVNASVKQLITHIKSLQRMCFLFDKFVSCGQERGSGPPRGLTLILVFVTL